MNNHLKIERASDVEIPDVLYDEYKISKPTPPNEKFPDFTGNFFHFLLKSIETTVEF